MSSTAITESTDAVATGQTRTLSTDTKITLDCPPGPRRPDTVLENILAELPELGLKPHDFERVSASFGEWVFFVYSDKEKIVKDNCSKIFDLIKLSHEQGKIRYGGIEPFN